MRFAVKLIGRLIFFVALVANFLLIILFILPISFLATASYGKVDRLEFESIPKPVVDSLLKNETFLPLSPDQPVNLIKQLMIRAIEIRTHRFMDKKEELALKLSVLDFGGGIVGIEKAAKYYLNKPLAELSEDEWILLVNLHQIFLK